MAGGKMPSSKLSVRGGVQAAKELWGPFLGPRGSPPSDSHPENPLLLPPLKGVTVQRLNPAT